MSAPLSWSAARTKSLENLNDCRIGSVSLLCQRLQLADAAPVLATDHRNEFGQDCGTAVANRRA